MPDSEMHTMLAETIELVGKLAVADTKTIKAQLEFLELIKQVNERLQRIEDQLGS